MLDKSTMQKEDRMCKITIRNAGIKQILKSGVRPPFDSLDGQNMVLPDDIARPHLTRIIEEYKNQQNIASFPPLSLLSDLNPIEHVWDKFG